MRLSVIIFCLAFILCKLDVSATHLIGGEISVKRVQNTALTFEITVVGYSERTSPVEFGYGTLDFGDGTVVNETFEKVKEIVTNEVLKTSFTVTHTFISASAAGYLIHYSEDPGRTEAINVGGGNVYGLNFYIETLLVIDPFIGTNSTPEFLFPPQGRAQVGKIYKYNPGAYDPDGDLLTYRLVNIKNDVDELIAGYQRPNHQDFYSNYESGNESGDSSPEFSIDRFTGEIIWDAPGDKTNRDGNADCENYAAYNIAIAVDEWRNVQGTWRKLGYVMRDFIVRVCDGDSQAQILDLFRDTCIVAESTLNKRALISEEQSVNINTFGIPFEKGASKKPGIDTLDIVWNTSCSDARKEPYQIQVILSDRNSDYPSLSNTYTWNVNIIAPPVAGITKSDQMDGSIKISWDAYACDKPDSLQIWRMEGSAQHTLCELQDPDALGFSFIGQVDADDIVFLDQNIPVNKKASDFTYHILPVFTDNQFETLKGLLTGIKKPESNVIFYPNPSKGSIWVQNKEQISQYRILSLSGKTLIDGELDFSGQINGLLSLLRPGMYIIQFQDKYEQVLNSGRLVLVSD